MKHISVQKVISILATLSLLASTSLIYAPFVSAGALTSASVQLSDSRPGQATTTYSFGFTTTVTTSIKQLTILFCTTASGTCTAPTGLVNTGATIGSDNIAGTGRTNTFSVNGTLTTVITTPATQSTQAVTISYAGITNPTSTGVYYARITTYSDAGTTIIDGPTSIAFAVTTGITASVTVDPSLTFAVNSVASSQSVNGATTTVSSTSTTIPFGSVSTSSNGIAAQQVVVTTNAQNGYTVYIKYTATPSDGNGHTIADLAGATNASPVSFSAAGTSAFGYTTTSTTLGTGTATRFSGGKWAAFTTSNLEVAHNSAAVSSDTTTIGYQVGIGGTQQAGTYTTTVVLTATPTY